MRRSALIQITPKLKYSPHKNALYFEKMELTPYDLLALKFSKILERRKIEHVIVAGYISTLFGRARITEDIDFIVKELNLRELEELIKEAESENLELMLIRKTEDAHEILLRGEPVRFCEKEIYVPNIEMKYGLDKIKQYALEKSLKVILPAGSLRISPLELQIAYKLWLGSKKDEDDAVFLQKFFKQILNQEELERWVRTIGVRR